MLAALNSHEWSRKLRCHWVHDAVQCLTQELYYLDALGLCNGGAPSNEYEPEAILSLAYICQVDGVRQLLALQEPPPMVSVSDDEIQSAIDRSFQVMLSECPCWKMSEKRSLLTAAREALASFPQRSGSLEKEPILLAVKGSSDFQEAAEELTVPALKDSSDILEAIEEQDSADFPKAVESRVEQQDRK